MNIDEKYMLRCLQLARCGRQNARPNPMVGAVLVSFSESASEPAMASFEYYDRTSEGRIIGEDDRTTEGRIIGKDDSPTEGRIIGEGYHVRYGQAHAEVNAFASVKSEDEPLISGATLYVSLEPCSHYGKTPPCADLIIKKGVKRVVVGCLDDFAQVQGRSIKKLRDAGIEVVVGVLEQECRELNRHFLTFHRQQRPYITLKWAQTANGFIDDHGQQLAISTPFTKMLVHKLRAEADAILVGRVTESREHPRLTVRHWPGSDPRRLVVDRQHPLNLAALHAHNVQWLIVEGGARTLQSFLDQGLWDEIRIETALNLSVADGTRSPQLPPGIKVVELERYGDNQIAWYRPL